MRSSLEPPLNDSHTQPCHLHQGKKMRKLRWDPAVQWGHFAHETKCKHSALTMASVPTVNITTASSLSDSAVQRRAQTSFTVVKPTTSKNTLFPRLIITAFLQVSGLRLHQKFAELL